MDSPINIGDTTTNSIQDKLINTHLHTNFIASVYNASYAGDKYIQLVIKLHDNPSARGDVKSDHDDDDDVDNDIIILRRVQDSYVNVNQLLSVLVHLQVLTNDQIGKFIKNEIVDNLQYKNIDGYTPELLDFNDQKHAMIKGYWITFDKAIYLSNKFGIYEIVKKLFLVNVHDFDELKKYEIDGKKRKAHAMEVDDNNGDGNHQSPPDTVESDGDQGDYTTNPNYPYSLTPIKIDDNNEVKLKFSQLFKKLDNLDTKSLLEEITKLFANYKKLELTDIPLDSSGKTALHFASTLGNIDLLSNLINLNINSPIRGSDEGETPLISCMMVTNSMEKGNFTDILKFLQPNIFLLNINNWSILHYLSTIKSEASNYYLNKILQFIVKTDNQHQQNNFYKFFKNVNIQDLHTGDTALHLAIKHENKWLINILLELNADINIENKVGIKPIDFEILKELINLKKLNQIAYNDDELYLIELVKTNVEFMNNKLNIMGSLDNDFPPLKKFKSDHNDDDQSSNLDASPVNKLFNSIKGLLDDTNSEYESIINNKRQQIKLLNQQLFNTTILTTNNKFLNKKINEKLSNLDNLKLQMSNITEKLEILKNELPKEQINETNENDGDNEAENDKLRFDADEPFRIDLLYNKLLKNEDVEEIKPQVLPNLPDAIILKARINSYKELNKNLNLELNTLKDYDDLTDKFKKVVSFCTGVDINEVDELLDGLLEAVESQQ